MKEFVEKLNERLEENIFVAELHGFGWDGQRVGNLLCLGDVKEIAEQLAEEHNNGWIPCSERLPENNRDVYVTYINKMTGDSISSVGWYSQEEKAWFVGHNDTRQKVTAWCPKLPPYKKGE